MQIFGGSPEYSKDKSSGSSEAASFGSGEALETMLFPGEQSMEEVLTGGVDRTAAVEFFGGINRTAEKEDWEIAQSRDLDMKSFAREFRKHFPADKFREPKTLEAATKWIQQKSKGVRDDALEIMTLAGLTEDFRTSILQNIKEENREVEVDASKKAVEKTVQKGEAPAQPALVLGKSVTASVNTKKLIGDYGIILEEAELQLWKKGKILEKIPVKSLGSFAVVADEIAAMETLDDLASFFGNKVLERETWLTETVDPRTAEIRTALQKEGAVESKYAAIFYNEAAEVVVVSARDQQTFPLAEEDRAIAAYLQILPPLEISAATFTYNNPAEQRKEDNTMPNQTFDPDAIDQNRERESDPEIPPLDANPKPVYAKLDADVNKLIEAIEDALGIQESKKEESAEDKLSDKDHLLKELEGILAAVKKLKPSKKQDKPSTEKKEPKPESEPKKSKDDKIPLV
jgi:hypothetical protein